MRYSEPGNYCEERLTKKDDNELTDSDCFISQRN